MFEANCILCWCFRICMQYIHQNVQGRLKNTYKLVNLETFKSSPLNKLHIFQCMGNIFCVDKGYLWNSAQNILPVHWKMLFLCNVENLRALRFTNSYVFLELTWCHFCGEVRSNMYLIIVGITAVGKIHHVVFPFRKACLLFIMETAWFWLWQDAYSNFHNK